MKSVDRSARTTVVNPQVEAHGKITFEEYLRRYTDVEGIHAEWLGGDVDVYPSARNLQHNQLLGFLLMLLDCYVDFKRIGKVIFSGLPIKWSDQHPARIPDIMVVLNPHLDRIKFRYIDGVVDIAIEIICPVTDARDRGVKFFDYEAAGVPEYWLFDPLRAEADVYALGEDRRYHRAARDGEGRLISSLMPGFALDTTLLWQTPLPNATEIVALAQSMATD